MAYGDRTACWHGLHVTERGDGELELEVDDQEEWVAWLEEEVWGRVPVTLLDWINRRHQHEALERELPWARVGVIRMAPDLVAYHYPEIRDNLT